MLKMRKSRKLSVMSSIELFVNNWSYYIRNAVVLLIIHLKSNAGFLSQNGTGTYAKETSDLCYYCIQCIIAYIVFKTVCQKFIYFNFHHILQKDFILLMQILIFVIFLNALFVHIFKR